jgi:iron complex outermembrane receptor protein
MSLQSSLHFATFAISSCTLAFYLVCQPVFATTDIEHIEIEGKAAGAKSWSVTAEQLQNQIAATSDTAALLSRFAGVTVKQAGAVSGLPSIRGLADDRIRIQVDGMDQVAACPNHMNPPLSYLAPSAVGKIRVFAGVTPVSVGGDSIGGSIISESLAPEFSAMPKSSGALGGFYRSNNQARGTDVKLSYSAQQNFAHYSGNWSKGNNYHAAADFKTQSGSGRPGHSIALDEVASTGFETQNHLLRLAHQQGADLVELQLGYQQVPYQGFANQRMDLLQNQQYRANLSWQRDTQFGQLKSRLYRENVEHQMDFGPDRQFWYGSLAVMGKACEPVRFHGDPAGTCAAGMPMNSESANSGFHFSGDVDLSRDSLLRLGTDWQQLKLDDYWTASGGAMGPGTFLNINQGERSRIAVFAEHELAINEDWLVQYGVRHERVERNAGPVSGYSTSSTAMGMQALQAAQFNQAERKLSDDNLDLSLVSRYQLHPQLELELAAAQKNRSANLYETYVWSGWAMAASMNNLVGDGNGYVGNLQLRPERARLLAASLNWHSLDQKHQLSVRPYLTRVDNYIDAVAANSSWQAGQFNILRYQNQQAELKGVDLSLQTELAQNQNGRWQFSAIGSYLDARNTDTGDGLYQTPPLHGRLTLNHATGGWDNSLEWQISKSKTRLSTIRGEQATPGYGIVALRLSHSWSQLRLDAGIENLFDTLYYLPQGGTYTGQGMTMSLNGIPFGIRMPGMGRSFYAGFNYRF